jgi:hypothetical protein
MSGQAGTPVRGSLDDPGGEYVGVDARENERRNTMRKKSAIVIGIRHTADDGELAVARRRSGDPPARIPNLFVVLLAETTQIGGEIVETDREQIDSVERRDFLGIIDPARTLQQDLHSSAPISRGCELRRRQPTKAELRQQCDLRAASPRRKARSHDDLPCLLDGFDTRNNDAASTTVEQTADEAVVALRNPYPGLHAEIFGRGRDLHGAIDRHAAVLEVDPDRAIAGAVRHACDVSSPRAADPQREDHFACREAFQHSHRRLAFIRPYCARHGGLRQFNLASRLFANINR